MTRLIKAAAAPGAAIAPLELRDVQRETDAILDAARRQAADIIRRAEAEAEARLAAVQKAAADRVRAALEEARAAGREQGVDEGRREALESAMAEARATFATEAGALMKAMTQAIDEWRTTHRQLFAEAGKDVAALCIAIARRVAPRLGELDPHIAADACAAALGVIGRRRDLAIHIHPDDLAALRQFADDAQNALHLTGPVRWVENATVGRGGARLELGDGAVDASLATQVDRIADELLEGWRSRLADLIPHD